jgi:hypothetical protein
MTTKVFNTAVKSIKCLDDVKKFSHHYKVGDKIKGEGTIEDIVFIQDISGGAVVLFFNNGNVGSILTNEHIPC